VGDRKQAARHAGTAQNGATGAGRARSSTPDTQGTSGTVDTVEGGSARVTGEILAFWGLGLVLVGSALAVVLSKNLFHAVLWLALALTGTAGVFLQLDAEFLAAVQLLLYAGGIVTIVVFAIVVTERLVGERISQTSRRIGGGAVVAAALLATIVSAINRRPLPVAPPALPADLTRNLGDAVLTRFVLPFELLALLMLAALMGAIYFARPDD